MANGSVDITVHIDESLEQGRLEAIAERVRKAAGVTSAEYHASRPHLLVVRYDPAHMSSERVHRLVRDQGVHAELIGF